jgi:hypothetical protein
MTKNNMKCLSLVNTEPGYMLDDRGSPADRNADIFSLPHNGYVVFHPGIMWPERKAEHSPPSFPRLDPLHILFELLHFLYSGPSAYDATD